MLKHFEVEGLNGIIDLNIDFHPDVNILTGRNGSGKTTILKLLWYLLSANIERIPREMSFRRILLTTDRSSVEIARVLSPSKKMTRYRFSYAIDDDIKEQLVSLDSIRNESEFVRGANMALSKGSPTVFFPTFRRIEGGFSLSGSKGQDQRQQTVVGWHRASGFRDLDDPGASVAHFMEGLSDRLSIGEHRFIASVSTEDVVNLLTNQYANISERTNKLHDGLNKEIFEIYWKLSQTLSSL